MLPQIRYSLGTFVAVPLLPLLIWQGKKIRTSVPRLPEAKDTQRDQPLEPEKDFVVLCLGESTMAGVGVDSHRIGFAGTLADALAEQLKKPVWWRVYAKSGYTAKQLRLRILPNLEEDRADLIVVSLGGNDAFRLNSPSSWQKEVTLLIKELRGKYPEVPIAFTNMPPIKLFPAFTGTVKFIVGNLVEILGQQLRRTVNSIDRVYYNEKVIRFKDWLHALPEGQGPGAFFSDGVHPSVLTYQLWARDFAKFLLEEAGLFNDSD